MYFHRPLDTLLDRPAKVRVLRFLCRKGGEWTGRRIAAELALHPTTAHQALRALRHATILDFQRAGNSFVYSLRDEHDLVATLLRPLFLREALLRERLVSVLRQGLRPAIRPLVVSAALYGSVAAGQERPGSDIDFVILVTSGKAKATVREAIGRLEERVLRVFGNPLAPYLHTVREAQQKHHRRLPVFQEILRTHQMVWGRPLAEVLRGGAT